MEAFSNSGNTRSNDLTSLSQAQLIWELHNIEAIHIKEMRALREEHEAETEKALEQIEKDLTELEVEHERVIRVFEDHLQKREKEVLDLIHRSEDNVKQHRQDLDAISEENFQLRSELEEAVAGIDKEMGENVADYQNGSPQRYSDIAKLRQDAASSMKELVRCRRESEFRRKELEKRDAQIHKLKQEVQERDMRLAEVKEMPEEDSESKEYQTIENGSKLEEILDLVGTVTLEGNIQAQRLLQVKYDQVTNMLKDKIRNNEKELARFCMDPDFYRGELKKAQQECEQLKREFARCERRNENLNKSITIGMPIFGSLLDWYRDLKKVPI